MIAPPKLLRRTICMDSARAAAQRKPCQEIPFHWDRLAGLALAPLRDSATCRQWIADPKSSLHRNLPASCCTEEQDNTAHKCNSAVSDGHIATVPGPPIHFEPIPDRQRLSH